MVIICVMESKSKVLLTVWILPDTLPINPENMKNMYISYYSDETSRTVNPLRFLTAPFPPNFNGGLFKATLKLEHGQVITLHLDLRMYLLIHVWVGVGGFSKVVATFNHLIYLWPPPGMSD